MKELFGEVERRIHIKSYNQVVENNTIKSYSNIEIRNLKNRTIANSFRNIYEMQDIIYRLLKTIDKEN